MTIGEEIKKHRKASGLTQKQLADLIGVEPQTIGKYETGIIECPPLEKLFRMREAMNADFSFLDKTAWFKQNQLEPIARKPWRILAEE